MKNRIKDRQRILHILDAIREIEKYIKDSSKEDFVENSMMFHASVKQLEIIGEAANNISEESKNNYTVIDWQEIIGMRHILVHEYFGIDAEIIWQAIMYDIPVLKRDMEKIANDLND